MDNLKEKQTYIYTYACHEEEMSLCRMELRALFGAEPSDNYIVSELELDPSRSPFMKMRVKRMFESDSLDQLAEQVQAIELEGATFKVIFVETGSAVDYKEQREIEKTIGYHIRGKAEMRKPDRLLGIVNIGGRWIIGDCCKSEAIWLVHNEKPQHYSTALSTRVARAVANLAVPHPLGVKAIDPCCGIGTVLVEALSMGIDIVGYDINPLAVRGARVNLAHFDMPSVVAIGDVRALTGDYDVAILDLPYNLCSVISEEERLEMLQSVRRLAHKAVIVTTETIDTEIERAGFTVTDRSVVNKGKFSRQIIVCRGI